MAERIHLAGRRDGCRRTGGVDVPAAGRAAAGGRGGTAPGDRKSRRSRPSPTRSRSRSRRCTRPIPIRVGRTCHAGRRSTCAPRCCATCRTRTPSISAPAAGRADARRRNRPASAHRGVLLRQRRRDGCRSVPRQPRLWQAHGRTPRRRQHRVPARRHPRPAEARPNLRPCRVRGRAASYGRPEGRSAGDLLGAAARRLSASRPLRRGRAHAGGEGAPRHRGGGSAGDAGGPARIPTQGDER